MTARTAGTCAARTAGACAVRSAGACAARPGAEPEFPDVPPAAVPATPAPEVCA